MISWKEGSYQRRDGAHTLQSTAIQRGYYEGTLDEPSGYLKTRKNISTRNRKTETITESSPQKLTAAEGRRMFDLVRWLKPMDGCIMLDWVLPSALIVYLLTPGTARGLG